MGDMIKTRNIRFEISGFNIVKAGFAGLIMMK